MIHPSRYLTLLTVLGFFLCYTSVDLKAKHIIGGDISYVCNGDGTYTFDMMIYRDCRDPEGANFDSPAVVSVYRGNSAPFQRFIRNVPGTQIVEQGPVPINDLECLVEEPGLCVQQARYIFTVTLPESPESYHIVYQRCCRNETITNILAPGSSGATYTMELTPEAQAQCNNSPVFNNFPPVLICAGSPLVFDHSATDPESDQLVYEFCAPLLGGGIAGGPTDPTGDANACNGVAPDPACGPPFQEVNYILPLYNSLSPMAGNPLVSIDPLTGLITGTPEILGQFVVGVCVSEFRNGELLSTIRRDFQFNVENCEPTVAARIRFDEQIGPDQFVVNSCGNSTITFENQSVQQQFIDEQYWLFEIDGVEERFNDWNATVTFPDIGTYEGRLLLNPGSECADTANIFVNIYPAIFAGFEYTYDTCVAGPVSFTDLSFTEASTIQTWTWDFDDGQFSNEQNPEHLFAFPGEHEVSLTIEDENGCVDVFTETILWYPAPPVVIIEPSIFDGCSPQEVFFNNLSFPIDSTYDIVWTFGDGSTSSDISPTHIYEEPGVYDVTVDITSPIGCYIGDSWDDWIRVRPSPIADFSFSPNNPTNFNPLVTFTDESFEPQFWEWDFDGDGFSFEQNPVFTFPDTGLQVVQLIVTHESGCQDSITQLIDVEPRIRYFIPNAFTPNSDDLNDEFKGGGFFVGMRDFRMTIWNRWGEMIFETRDPNEGWNGRKFNTGELAPLGVYVYIINYLEPRGKRTQLKGFATLLK
ncbi:MAG: PKD domain-containing protein [Bacteroidota bacterium]